MAMHKYLFSNVSKKYYSTFKSNELVIAYIRNFYYNQNSLGSSRIIELTDKGIFKTKYFDIMHKHIIDRNVDNCYFKIEPENSIKAHKIVINVRRLNLFEYIFKCSTVAVPSQFSILSFVPFLLELDKSKKILESGTGNASMTLYLSQYLDANSNGLIHTFDVKPVERAKAFYTKWKNSYDIFSQSKLFDNVEFFSSDITKHEFGEEFNGFYDAFYFDLPDSSFAIKNAYRLLKSNGIIVINVLHLTQLMGCLKVIEDNNLNLVKEIILEPSTRMWEVERYTAARNNKTSYDEYLGFKCRILFNN